MKNRKKISILKKISPAARILGFLIWIFFISEIYVAPPSPLTIYFYWVLQTHKGGEVDVSILNTLPL